MPFIVIIIGFFMAAIIGVTILGTWAILNILCALLNLPWLSREQ